MTVLNTSSHSEPVPYINNDKQWFPSVEKYSQQFSQIYFVRISMLRPILQEAAYKRWSDFPDKPVHVGRVLDTNGGTIGRSYIIGTLFAELPYKPNVLDALAHDLSLAYIEPPGSYVVSEDSQTTSGKAKDPVYYLEDESGRIKIDVSAIPNKTSLVTGITIAALGRINREGSTFTVEDICFAGLPKQPTPFTPVPQSQPHLMLIVSGLNSKTENCSDIAFDLLIEWIINHQHEIAHIVFAGNCVPRVQTAAGDNGKNKFSKENIRYDTSDINSFGKRIESLLSECESKIRIDIMPGDSDVSVLSWPQTPIHPGILEIDNKKCLVPASNPHAFSIANSIECLISSGLNLDDACKYSTVGEDSRVDVAADMLKWRHIAPTAPDTLPCYPFYETDPFILSSLPHTFIVANQPAFQSKKIEENGVLSRVVLCPSFWKTSSSVLLDLRDLSCRELTIRV